MKFRLTHAIRGYIMSLLASTRLKFKAGTKVDLKLAAWYQYLLDKQMEARRKAGVQEIQCYVEWGGTWDD
jgi:hypothetical protein